MLQNNVTLLVYLKLKELETNVLVRETNVFCICKLITFLLIDNYLFILTRTLDRIRPLLLSAVVPMHTMFRKKMLYVGNLWRGNQQLQV